MKGVEILTGDPKKALIKLSIPIMISNLVFTLYNLADGAWVAGLGADALSAIGIFFPLFMVFVALSFGVGVGAASAISRRIGAEDKKNADNTAIHAIITGLVVAGLLMLIILRLREFLEMLGARGDVLSLALSYSRIIIAGAIFLVFNNVATGIMNGEGNTRRTMYANVVGTSINIIIDPIFIYVLGFGIAGAAYATVLSMAISSSVFLFWFLSGKTFVKPSLKNFRYDGKLMIDILRVGLPSSFSLLSMSIAMAFLNVMILEAGGSDGIAVFTGAWRFVNFGFIPLFGLAGALTVVTGASFGARNAEKLKTAYYHAIRLSALIEMMIVFLMVTASSKLALFFTYSQASIRIYQDLVIAMRILPLFLIFTPFGIMTVAMFQGIGRGENSLGITLMRTIIFQLAFSYILAFSYHLGFFGILVGVTLGNVVASVIAFTWGTITVRKLEKELAVKI